MADSAPTQVCLPDPPDPTPPRHPTLPPTVSECVTVPLCVCVCSHLQVPDELSHGDLLRHPVVEAVAVEHHALQDGQGALQDGHVHHGLVHVAGDLKPQRGLVPPSQQGELILLHSVAARAFHQKFR